MGTSLSEQLKRLALPQTNLIQRDKERASLLFDPKEAGGLKRETVYQIALDGLEELIQKNQAFERYKNTIFHISSRKFERSVQTSDTNKKLDKVIRKFLLELSPYFLLNCSHKTLEWLINRYSIHEFNRDDLLMAIMPYHESNIFVRIVQLMKFKDQNDPWFFLKSLQKTGVHLTKQNLLSHATSEAHFLKCVGKFLTLLIKHSEKPSLLTVAFNFYCAVYTGTIEFSTEMNEAQITQMLPTLLKGLNSEIPDYCAASYIILGRLLMKTALTDVILNKFVEKVVETKIETLKTETILVLMVLYQTQHHYNDVPEEACAILVEKEWLPKVLQDLRKGKYCDVPFLKALVKACLNGGVKMDRETHRQFLNKLLATLNFENDFVDTFLSLLLDNIKAGKQYSEHIREWLREVLETLERQYPQQFDDEIYKILSTPRQGKFIKRRKCLQQILNETMTLRCKFDVLDKLYHPNASFRTEALRYLMTNFDLLKEREKEMIKSSFIDRLNDDDVNVVAGTLNLIKNISLLKTDTLRDVLIKLTYKCQHDLKTWGPIGKDVVLLLCAYSNSNDWETFIAIFPYLLPGTAEELETSRELSKSPFIKNNSLLQTMSHDIDDFEHFCNNVFENLKNEDFGLVNDFLEDFKQKPLEEKCALNKYVFMLILTCILPNNSPIEMIEKIVSLFISILANSNVRYEKGTALFQRHIAVARGGQFSIEAFLLCLKNIVLKTRKPELDLGCVDLHEDSSFNRYFTALADAFFRSSQNHKKYTLFFVRHFCKDLRSKLEFILNLATSEKCSNPEFLSECVNLIIRLLEHSVQENELKLLFSEGEILLPYILALLMHKSEKIKEKAFRAVEIIAAKSSTDDFFSDLFTELLEQREEIVADSDQMPLILFNYLSSLSVKSKKLSSNAQSVKIILIKASCKANYPIYVKAKMLELLSHINTNEIFEETAEDCLTFLGSTTSFDTVKSAIVARNVLRCQASIVQDIRLNTNVWGLIETCLRNDEQTIIVDGKTIFTTVLLLEQISREFFAQATDEVKLRLLDVIVETTTLTKNSEILPMVKHIIKIIDLDAKLILPHFTAMRDVQSPKLDQSKLRRRIGVVPTIDILDTLEWKKGITALEFIQDKKKLRNVPLLLQVLFDVLKKCLDFDEQAAVEYPKQLILSSILDLSARTEKDHLPETMFNIELIVQCIRASQNPQTHYCALVLLAFSAELFPMQVLHNIMAIFTFMGSSLLRHEDVYSFQIISKTIDTIIPILVKDGDRETISRVLRVFVDVLLDVPEHRRMLIYGQLLTKIGVTDYLHVFLLLLFESHVNHSTVSKKDDVKRLEVAASICREFPPKVVIQNCIHLIKYLKELPDELEGDSVSSNFDIHYKTPKHFRHYKYTLITFTSKLLASKEFVLQVAGLTTTELLGLEQLYKDMIINILTYIHRVSKVSDKNTTSPQAKYWKVILYLSYDILDSVNAILTPQMFLLVIKGLMLHNFSTVRRRSMELLNSKLQNNSEFFNDCASEELYSLVPPLLSIIKNIEETETESEEELIVQTALLSLKLLVKLLVSEHQGRLVEILDFFADLTKSEKLQSNVLASVLLCLAELCANLRAHAIPSLPNIVPILLKILKQQNSQDTSNLLLLSSVTAIHKILITLPLFLSPYLEKLLYELSLLAARWSGVEEKSQPIMTKLSTLRQQIGASIPARVLIPILGHSYDRLISKNEFAALAFLMEVLGENLNHCNGSEVSANLPELTNFFLNALQFRTVKNTSFIEANKVESEIINVLTKLILKLSESTFKPLFYKLFDWAVRHEEKTEKLITFYALSRRIAESLKSLFVLFAGHFLNNAAHILDACNVVKSDTLYFDEEKTNFLLENVLKTLYTVFLHDNHRFVNKDRFHILMQPLVDQLENTLGGVVEKRNTEFVTPTIVQFAVAAADDSLWKQLNYQILLKMKHNSPTIRLSSLFCLKEMVKKLGVDYLPLLPEAIPVLAELLEDEEENVENACRRTVQEMEKILGEPIEKYFKM